MVHAFRPPQALLVVHGGGCDILILLCYTNYNDGIVLFYAQENGAESAWVKRDDASSWFYNSAGWERK